MTMIADTLIGETRPEIIAQWKAGTLVRRGGVLYRRPGLPGGGRIVAHLRDVGEVGGGLSPLAGIAGLAKVAAAASVVGLGVSVAGFAATLYKLHQLQKSVAALSALVSAQGAATMERLDQIATVLVEVKAVQAKHGAVLGEVLEQIQLVRLEQSLAQIAKVRAALELLEANRAPTEQQHDQTVRVLREAATYFELTIDQSPLRRDRPSDWVDVLMRYRGWCLATVAEVSLARRLGRTEDAAALATSRATIARAWCATWSQTLMPREEFGGVFRLAHRGFREVPREQFARLARAQGTELSEAIDARELDAAREVSAEAPALGLGWWERERASADVLDFCEETAERLESLAAEMLWCQEQGLHWSEWEGLPAPAEAQGLVLVLREETGR